MKIIQAITVIAAILFPAGLAASATTYEVGPGRQMSALAEVPWEALQPGDTVLIHWRPEPYREKFVLCRAGTEAAPITVRGVPGPDGALPMLSGDGATTPARIKFWGGPRGVVKIGGAEIPPDTMPAYIVIENLDVSGARRAHTFTGTDGKSNVYRRDAAAIQIEKGEHIVIRHCRLHDCGNGLFISSNDQRASRDILVEGNDIFDNGNPHSGQEHNVYTEADGLIFQFNRLGPLCTNSLGNNLKDRSAGLVVRYNWIEGGNKELDLVDAEDSAIIRKDPRYRDTYVYGNVLLKLPVDLHPQLVHYGGDSDNASNYRKGTLHFFNNTVISYRSGTTTLFWLWSKDESCDLRANLCYAIKPKTRFVIAQSAGNFALDQNWFFPAVVNSGDPHATAAVAGGETSLTSPAPQFVDVAAKDFHPAGPVPARHAELDAGLPPVALQYASPQSGEPRADADAPGLGAYSSPRSVNSSSSSPR
jgi:hypothetical protein